MFNRKSSLHNVEITEPGLSPHKISPVRKLSKAFARFLSFRRNSESAVKNDLLMVEGEDEEVANYSDDQSHIIKTRNVKKKAAG